MERLAQRQPRVASVGAPEHTHTHVNSGAKAINKTWPRTSKKQRTRKKKKERRKRSFRPFFLSGKLYSPISESFDNHQCGYYAKAEERMERKLRQHSAALHPALSLSQRFFLSFVSITIGLEPCGM